MSPTEQQGVSRSAEAAQREGDSSNMAKEPWRRRWVHWIDGLWGYDVFISHRRSDAAPYARQLHRSLGADDTNSFIDATHFVPGDPLPQATLRNVRKSTLLVVLVTPNIVEPRFPDWVLAEVEAYLTSHAADPRVIAVFFTNTPNVMDHPIVQQLTNFLHLEQPLSALDAAPSDQVITAIRAQLGSRRRDRGRIRLFQYIATTVSILALVAIIAARGFWTQWTLADRNAREATSRLLAFESSFERSNFPQRSLLLAAASVDTTRIVDHKVLPESYLALLDDLQVVGGQPIVPELGKFSFLDSGNSGLVLGKAHAGELFILNPFAEAPEAKTISLPTGAKAVWAAVADGKLVVLDETSSIFRCLIAHEAASACEKVLTVDGATALTVAPANAARILLTTPAGQEVWDLDSRQRLHSPDAANRTPATGYTISPKGRFLARIIFNKREDHDSGLLELTNVETGEITRFDWREDSLYVELRSFWFGPDDAALVVESVRWRRDPSHPALLSGTPAMIGVRLGQEKPRDFDIARALGWDSPQWRATNFQGEPVLRTTAQGMLEIYRTGGPNGLARSTTFGPVSLDSTFFPSKDGCAVAEATKANAIYLHFATCEGRPYSKLRLSAAQGSLEGRRIFVDEASRLVVLLGSEGSKSVDVWHAPTDQDSDVRHWTLTGNEAITTNILFPNTGTKLIGVSLKGELRRWDLQSSGGDVPWTVYRHPNYVVTQLANSTRPGLLAHVSGHGGLVLSDLRGKDPIHHRLIQELSVGLALRFFQDDKYLVFADVNGSLYLWDVATVLVGASASATRSVVKGPLTGLEISGNGSYIAVGSDQPPVLHIYRVTLNPIALTPVCEIANQAGQVTAGIDGSTFFAGMRDGREIALVQIDPRQSGCSRQIIEEKSPASHDVHAVSIRNGLLAYASRKSGKLAIVLRRIDPATGRPGAQAQELAGPETQVTALAFSPDGRWLAAGDTKGTGFVWKLDNDGHFKLAAQSDVHAANSPGMNSDIAKFAFDPSGNWLASSSALRHNVVLWDLSQTPPATARVSALNSNVSTLSFTPSGQLVIGRWDGRVEIWPLSIEELLRRACAVAGRELAESELTPLIGNVQVAFPCKPALSGRHDTEMFGK